MACIGGWRQCRVVCVRLEAVPCVVCVGGWVRVLCGIYVLWVACVGCEDRPIRPRQPPKSTHFPPPYSCCCRYPYRPPPPPPPATNPSPNTAEEHRTQNQGSHGHGHVATATTADVNGAITNKQEATRSKGKPCSASCQRKTKWRALIDRCHRR
jgi:hypothetical protein